MKLQKLIVFQSRLFIASGPSVQWLSLVFNDAQAWPWISLRLSAKSTNTAKEVRPDCLLNLQLYPRENRAGGSIIDMLIGVF